MIDEVIPSLPIKEESIKSSYENCFSKRCFIEVDNREFSAHLEKAKSDLARVKNDYQQESWDWVIVKSYYSIMHAFNALLVKEKGFFSKDHFCTILSLKYFELVPREMYLKLRNIHTKFSDFTGFDVTYSLRKISQYDVYRWKEIAPRDAEAVYQLAKEVVSFVEKRCYR